MRFISDLIAKWSIAFFVNLFFQNIFNKVKVVSSCSYLKRDPKSFFKWVLFFHYCFWNWLEGIVCLFTRFYVKKMKVPSITVQKQQGWGKGWLVFLQPLATIKVWEACNFETNPRPDPTYFFWLCALFYDQKLGETLNKNRIQHWP